MTDVEQLVRETLARHQHEVPEADPLEVRPVVRRAHRRQVVNVMVAGVVAAVIALGAISGIGGILRTEGKRPASRPLEPPQRAPIVVESATTQGWRWQLSTSADATCLALTDAQGSEMRCSSVGDGVDVFVRRPRPPAPSVTILFGRLPDVPASVRADVPSRRSSWGYVMQAPGAVEAEVRYYTAVLNGEPYPYVPDVVVRAFDGQDREIATGTLERPSWAPAPFTRVATIASGRLGVVDDPAERWEIDVFHDGGVGGPLCVGEPGGASACSGDPFDPGSMWQAMWESSLEVVVADRYSPAFAEYRTFVWGAFRDPVQSVTVESPNGHGGWRAADVDLFHLPAEYGNPFSIYVATSDGEVVRVRGFDAKDQEIARERRP